MSCFLRLNLKQEPKVSHDIGLSSSYDFTKLLYYIVSQP